MLDLRKNKIALSVSIVIHTCLIGFFAIKNISSKPSTSMTVVNLVENIPNKKVTDVHKNKNIKVIKNKLVNANQNKKDSNLIKFKNKDFSKYNQKKNMTFEREIVSEKKKNSFFQKKITSNSENQKDNRYEENHILKKKKSSNSVSRIIKSSAKYKIGTIKNPHPEYPMIARKKGWQGRLVLNVRISENGDVIKVNIVQTSGFKILDEASVNTIKDWKFTPARVGKKNVEDNLNIPVSFKLIN